MSEVTAVLSGDLLEERDFVINAHRGVERLSKLLRKLPGVLDGIYDLEILRLSHRGLPRLP